MMIIIIIWYVYSMLFDRTCHNIICFIFVFLLLWITCWGWFSYDDVQHDICLGYIFSGILFLY